jgi:hypothetical protein
MKEIHVKKWEIEHIKTLKLSEIEKLDFQNSEIFTDSNVAKDIQLSKPEPLKSFIKNMFKEK